LPRSDFGCDSRTTASSSPDRSAWWREGCRCGHGPQGSLPPEATVLAERYDGGAAAIQDCGMAAPGVKGAVAGHGADLFIRRDLIQQVRQYRAVPLTARGELHRPDVTGACIHRQMNLAVLAPAMRAVLARQPFSFIGLTRPHWGHGPSSPQELDPPRHGHSDQWRSHGSMSTSRFSGPGARRQDI
jgi:hypothetical protein